MIEFAGIPVRDQYVALKFYTETMGMKVLTDQPFMPQQRWIELMIPGCGYRYCALHAGRARERIGEFQSTTCLQWQKG